MLLDKDGEHVCDSDCGMCDHTWAIVRSEVLIDGSLFLVWRNKVQWNPHLMFLDLRVSFS
jgi:hypothetical protein